MCTETIKTPNDDINCLTFTRGIKIGLELNSVTVINVGKINKSFAADILLP